MTLTALIDQAKELAESLCEDTCSIVDPTHVNDGWGGQTPTGATVASDIPCIYEALNDQTVVIGGGDIASVTHKLYLMTASTQQAIKPDYQIIVDARGDKPALTFTNPRRMSESYEALLTVSAKLQL